MTWKDLLASACTEQTLARAQSCLKKNTVYVLGGNDNDPTGPFPHQCDCSGFVDWSIGTWRQVPPHSDHWLYTDSIWEGGGEVGKGLFSEVKPPDILPGDLFVYPSPAPHHVGHVSIIVAIVNGAPSQIIHCSSSNYHNFNDAIRATAPTVFLQNPVSKIMRPDYNAIRKAAGL